MSTYFLQYLQRANRPLHIDFLPTELLLEILLNLDDLSDLINAMNSHPIWYRLGLGIGSFLFRDMAHNLSPNIQQNDCGWRKLCIDYCRFKKIYFEYEERHMAAMKRRFTPRQTPQTQVQLYYRNRWRGIGLRRIRRGLLENRTDDSRDPGARVEDMILLEGQQLSLQALAFEFCKNTFPIIYNIKPSEYGLVNILNHTIPSVRLPIKFGNTPLHNEKYVVVTAHLPFYFIYELQTSRRLCIGQLPQFLQSMQGTFECCLTDTHFFLFDLETHVLYGTDLANHHLLRTFQARFTTEYSLAIPRPTPIWSKFGSMPPEVSVALRKQGSQMKFLTPRSFRYLVFTQPDGSVGVLDLVRRSVTMFDNDFQVGQIAKWWMSDEGKSIIWTQQYCSF